VKQNRIAAHYKITLQNKEKKCFQQWNISLLGGNINPPVARHVRVLSKVDEKRGIRVKNPYDYVLC